MDEKLVATVRKIRQLANENQEFANEMKKMFAPKEETLVSNGKKDILAIRSALKICAEPSISYEFVRDQRVKDQLIIDNLRMENVLLDTKLSEYDKYYAFCVNGLYQIENIINYYLYVKYPDFDKLVRYLEVMTARRPNDKVDYSFRLKDNMTSIQGIDLYSKINAVCREFYSDNLMVSVLSSWRKIRNQSEHRCNIISISDELTEDLQRFYRYNTYNALRDYLRNFVKDIENHLSII